MALAFDAPRDSLNELFIQRFDVSSGYCLVAAEVAGEDPPSFSTEGSPKKWTVPIFAPMLLQNRS